MTAAQSLAYAVLTSPDPERLGDHYCQTIGFGVAARDANRLVLRDASGNGCLVIERGEQPACPRLAFTMARDFEPQAALASLARLGLQPRIGTDQIPGFSKTVTFRDPNGTAIDLVVPDRQGIPATKADVTPLKLGHVAFATASPADLSAFYAKTLGFRESDWVEAMFVFLRCGPDHHTVNFLKGPRTGLHHIAFELRDWAHVAAMCDKLGRNGHPLIWGPGRHTVGSNGFIYYRDPDDNIVEFYVELDQMKSEELGYFEPRPWHRSFPQRPRRWSRDEGLPQWGAPPTPDFRRAGSDHLIQQDQ